ncbi:hypothetical protein HRbin41_01470 [bacterium HR41]|nr:hypothetical protein HRbin41_01470 [bacterium HR41]
MAGEELGVQPDTRRRPLVVARQEHQNVAVDLAQAAIEGGYQAAVRLAHVAHTVAVGTHELGGAIGRTVVDDDDLKQLARIVLSEGALDRAHDEALEGVGDDQTADLG